jgi:hypothetical protein
VSVIKPVVQAIVQPIAGPVSPVEPGPSYTFDGLAMYAAMLAWIPNGLPFDVSVEGTLLTVDLTNRRLLSAAGNVPGYLYNQATTDLRMNYAALDAAVTPLAMGTVVASEPFKIQGRFEGGGSAGVRDGVQTSVNAKLSESFEANGIAVIAANIGGNTNFWHGPIKQLKLIDRSPIQDTSAQMGDNVRYGELPLMAIPASDDFTVSFDWLREDRDGVSAQRALNNETDSNSILLTDTANANPDRFSLVINGLFVNAANALERIALGQHCHIDCIVTKGDTRMALLIDGEQVAAVVSANVTNDWAVDEIGSSQAASTLAAGAAIQNLSVTNNSTGERWFYPLDEGTGAVINNTDPVTGPEGAGQWLPDASWKEFEDNTRYYAMDEGVDGGGIFRCVDGNGVSTPANDATIANYNPAAWG